MRKLNECLDFDNRKNDSEKLETAKNYTLSRLMFKYFFFLRSSVDQGRIKYRDHLP